jgi:hypothetical protein
MTSVTLVVGPVGQVREQAIADRLDPAVSSAVILEGFPDGNSILQNRPNHPDLKILRIASGCMCCTGNLVLRVTLNRILRPPPKQLFLSLADASHLDTLRRFLTEAPYDHLLSLTEDCCT